ncbi:MAG: helix-turn-helix transcriptional regulator [Colwellia sp.]|nr:helix-turn-helix transcriptional regulator [Colwellia sp.]
MSKDIDKKIFDKIASIRELDAKMSLRAFAAKLGLNENTYGTYEKRSIPRHDILIKICAIPKRKIRPAWVLFDEEPRYVDMIPTGEPCPTHCSPDERHIVDKLIILLRNKDEIPKKMLTNNINTFCGDKLWVHEGRPERRKKYIPIKSILERRAKVHDYGNGN